MRSADRRLQLLEAARLAFSERGYRGVTTSDLAASVGVSDALVLKYFGTKENLFRAAVVEPLLQALGTQIEQNRARLDAGASLGHQQAAAAIGEFLRAWARLVRERRQELLSLFADLREFPDVGDRVLSLISAQIDDLGSSLQVDPALYRPVDTQVATWASIAAATLAGLNGERDSDIFVDEYVKILMLGVLRPPA